MQIYTPRENLLAAIAFALFSFLILLYVALSLIDPRWGHHSSVEVAWALFLGVLFGVFAVLRLRDARRGKNIEEPVTSNNALEADREA